MSLFSQSDTIASPLQNHAIAVMSDVQLITGELETLGMPHPYINQGDLELFKIQNATVSPWAHLNLPMSKNPMVMVNRTNIQLFTFTDSATNEEYRQPPRIHMLLITLPIAILRGKVPFMSDAAIPNFMEFFKGTFIPVIDPEVHYFVSSGTNLVRKASLMYVNRNSIQSYVDAE